SEHEVLPLLDAPDCSAPLGRRDRAILTVLVFTGLRLSELTELNTLDLDFSRKTMRVLGKGSKERLVPMNEPVEAAMRGMLEDPERKSAAGERAVFLNARGRRMTPRAIEYLVDKYVEQAAVGNPRISPHKLRHTFATLLHGRGVDLIDIQALMGHSSLASTQIYTHTDANRLRGAIERLDFES
ncbi:tyrosine-type recombinase/integrase, partial [Candidatus Poribacteria bacterium]|nr:tyrosine-type recombinase/integrase [Candidatus Poribacteria bacterium]